MDWLLFPSLSRPTESIPAFQFFDELFALARDLDSEFFVKAIGEAWIGIFSKNVQFPVENWPLSATFLRYFACRFGQK